jgi:hypothetical protein
MSSRKLALLLDSGWSADAPAVAFTPTSIGEGCMRKGFVVLGAAMGLLMRS